MKKNQLTTTKSTALVLGKSKSLMCITKKLLESKGKGLTQAKPSQELSTHKDITIIGELMWEKESREMNWSNAMEYAKNLRLGGYDDWRLPTIKELGEVVTLCGGEVVTFDDEYDDGKCDGNWENTQYHEAYKTKGFTSDLYCSSTTGARGTSSAWVVRFGSGRAFSSDKPSTHYVRCVR